MGRSTVQPISVSNSNIYLTSTKSKRIRLGAVGILASVLTLPFLSKDSQAENDLTSQPAKTQAAKSLILTGSDKERIDAIRKYVHGEDLASEEISWAETVWPTVRWRLINLYEAEKLDNEEIKAGKITDKDRRVKISYTGFIPPGQRGNDGDSELNFHIVKRLDEKQKDGNILRTYVNESWPLIENGMLAPGSIRARVQYIPGDLTKEGAEDLFVTDLLHAIWVPNYDGSAGNSSMFARLYRQQLFGPYNKELERYETKQVQVPVSSPLKCAGCHSSKATFTQDIFLKPGEKRTNYGAIVPDEDFHDVLPLSKQLGYIELTRFLNDSVKGEKFNKEVAEGLKRSLLNISNIETPYMAESLKLASYVPWVGEDQAPDWGKGVDPGYVYEVKRGEKVLRFEKAGARVPGADFYIGSTWWQRNELLVLPK